MCSGIYVDSPPLHHLQSEVQQLSLGLLSPLDHLQDGDSSAQVPAQLQHLLIRRLVILSVLKMERLYTSDTKPQVFPNVVELLQTSSY